MSNNNRRSVGSSVFSSIIASFSFVRHNFFGALWRNMNFNFLSTQPRHEYELIEERTKRKRKRNRHQKNKRFSLQKRNFMPEQGEVEDFKPGDTKVKIDHNPELTPMERFDQNVLKQAFDNGRPLEGKEYWIPAAAFLAVVGACSTSKDFGDRFIEGLQEKVFGIKPPESGEAMDTDVSYYAYAIDGVEIIVGVANLCTQASLTAKSFIHVQCRLSRMVSTPNHEYMQELSLSEKLVLTGVTLTGFASAKMVFDSMSKKYKLPGTASYTLSTFSFFSSFFVNENFTYDRLLAMHQVRNDLAIIRLLTKAKDEVNKLANNSENPDAFIERLGTGTWFRQLILRNTAHSTPEQNQDTILQLLQITETTAGSNLFDPAKDWAWLNTDNVLSVMLGILASAMNAKAGLQVPNFITGGYLPEINVNEFFTHFLEQSWEVYGTFLFGMMCFGLTSGAVNSIINSRSCHELITTIKKFLPIFLVSGFSSISSHEQMILAAIIFLSTGYAIGKAGAMLKYALIEVAPIPISMAIATVPVFEGLGVMSMTGATAAGRNAKDWKLFDDAIAAPSLLHFYHHLPFDDQMTLRRLLLTRFTLAIDGMYAYYNQTKPHVNGEHLFNPTLLQALEEKFGVNAGNEEVISIKVQPEEEQKDLLYSPDSPGLTSQPTSPTTLHGGSPHALFSRTKKNGVNADTAASMNRLGLSQILFTPGSPARRSDAAGDTPSPLSSPLSSPDSENDQISPVLSRQYSHSHNDLYSLGKQTKGSEQKTSTPTSLRYGSYGG
ncbi:MAG: hypothetical protein V4501_05105 [Pseudomonadota bacterium]